MINTDSTVRIAVFFITMVFEKLDFKNNNHYQKKQRIPVNVKRKAAIDAALKFRVNCFNYPPLPL